VYCFKVEFLKYLHEFLLRLIDKVNVKGKHEAVECYEPVGFEASAGEELEARVAAYHTALDDYHEHQWNDAQAQLEILLGGEPECRRYRAYLERIETLRTADLPADWVGA
tara:strand:+ start:320 stop:649 length:330 start_codon:yes stop_codon:yes gene_type:complete